MFLRSQNNVPEVRASILALDERVRRLKHQIAPVACAEDALARLELAEILKWRGLYRQTMELVLALDSPDFEAEIGFRARQLIGDNHFRHDQYDLANKQYHLNFDLATAAGDEYWISRAEDGFAWVLIDVGHYTTGEFKEAEGLFQKQLLLHRRLGNRNCEGMALYGVSRAAAGMGDYTRAVEFALSAIEVLMGGGEFLLQLPLLQIANIHRDRGDFELARDSYEIAIDAADRSQDPYWQVLTGIDRGILYQFMDESEEAIRIWRLVLEEIRLLDFPRLGLDVCNRLASILAERREYEDAYRMQVASQQFGNRVGVLSSNLHNQQMRLREQIHQSAQLEATLTYLGAGVEASTDGIFVLERVVEGDGREEFLFHYLNDSASQMLGKKAVAVNHVPVRSSWKSDSAERLLIHSRIVSETGEPCTLDPVELVFEIGVPRWYSVKIAKSSGGVVWTICDVTARESMQREILAQRDRLEQANARLTALDREKSEMLGVAAHDLRSPIGNIRALCELIATDDSESQDLLRMIGEISGSLLNLISNLLDVERIERGELQLELAPVEIGRLAERLVEQFSVVAKSKNITLRLEIPQAPLTGLADENALMRAMENLISNAVKFSPPGSRVWVRALDRGDLLRIEIADQGCGITAADRKKMFGKFSRLSAKPTGSESSTGLGLSIVKQLVEAMHGQVGCESEPGNGATFWIEVAKFQSGASALSPTSTRAA
jgi:signal transduction histidine kinase